jgi:hypothetical protein
VCDAHVRSAIVFGTKASNSVVVHGVRGLQALASSVSENVLPATQATHWRLAVFVPARCKPKPMPHVRQAAQAWLPSLALNCPVVHSAQVRSLETVAGWSMYWPAGQGLLTLRQTSPLLMGENVSPTMQVAQLRSAVGDPATDCPCPTAQVVHVVQADTAVEP